MSTCDIQRIIPGPTGPTGTNGASGASGANAISYVMAPFAWPAELASVVVTVDSNVWLTPGAIVYVQNGGFTQVVSIAGTTAVTLLNLKDTPNSKYLINVAPGTVIAPTNKLGATGLQGPSGNNGTSGAPTTDRYILQIADAGLPNAQGLSTLATGLVKNANGTGVLSVAADGTDYLSPATGLAKANNLSDLANAATARTNLILGALATLNAVNNANWAGAALGVSNGGTGATTAAAARAALSVLPQYGLLGTLSAINLNAGATDSAFAITAARYRIDRITVENASISVTIATFGVFTAAGGAGVTLAADQSLVALTAASKFKDITLQGVTSTDSRTETTLYARVGTPQGAPATANLFLYGWVYA